MTESHLSIEREFPSQIGVLLRDQKGIGQVKNVTGSKILRLLKKNGGVSAFRS